MMLSEDAVADAERLIAFETISTAAIADSRIDDDRVARAKALHLIADPVDRAGAVTPQDPRRYNRDSGKSVEHEQIEMIERRRGNPDADIRRPAKLGDRQVISILELLEATVCRDGECAHGRVILNGRTAGTRDRPGRTVRTSSTVCA